MKTSAWQELMGNVSCRYLLEIRCLATPFRPMPWCWRAILFTAVLTTSFDSGPLALAQLSSVRLGTGLPGSDNERQVPEAWAVSVERAPRIDGRLDDAAWSEAPVIVLRKLDTGDDVSPRSLVRLVHAAGVLFVGCDFEEPRVDALRKSVRRTDGPVWEDDSLELFLSPDPTRGYYQIIVGAGHAIYDRRNHGDPSAWDSGTKAAVVIRENGWSAEVAVPFASLGAGRKPPERWRANVYRNRYAGPEGAQQAFSPTYSADYDVPHRFGILHFVVEPPSQTDPPPGRSSEAAFRSISRAISIDDLGPRGAVLVFDLASIPTDARILRAGLVCERNWGSGEDLLAPVEILPTTGRYVRGRAPEAVGPALELPRSPSRSVDVTVLVRGWVRGRDPAALYVKRLAGWRRQRTWLDVVFEPSAEGGPLPPVPAQVDGLRAIHRAGQTFLTWNDREDRFGEGPVTWDEIRRYRNEIAPKRPVLYRVYRHSEPMDAATIRDAALIDEVAPLSGFNVNSWSLERLVNQTVFGREDQGELGVYGPFEGWTPASPEGGTLVIPRLAIADGKPLPPGTGLCVHSASLAQEPFYAVTAVVDGIENLRDFSPANSLQNPVSETPSEWEPVEQPPGEPFGFDFRGTRRYYVTWAAPPLAPRPMYFNWSVLVPESPDDRSPVELYFHRPGASYARPPVKFLDRSFQICPHDLPFSGWYGFNDAAGTLASPAVSVVRPHTIRRIEAFLKWACRRFPLDPGRIIGVGGDGAALMTLYRPKLFAYVLITGFESLVLDPGSTLAHVEAWGPASPRVQDEAGPSGWAWGELDRLLCGEAMPAVLPRDAPLPVVDPASSGFRMDLPLFVCRGPSWGRNPDYGHGRGRFYYALQATRNPLHGHWAWGGKLTAPEKFSGLWRELDLRVDTPVPAVTNSTVDAEGEGSGHTNTGYRWHDTREDEEGFEVTAIGPPSRFDLTPRRLSRFKPEPGSLVLWDASPVEAKTWDRAAKPSPLSGRVTADANGLVTLKGLELVRGWALRIVLRKASGEGKTP